MAAPLFRPYRPDIDGLRAIAVLAVIAFHASPGLVPGGFVGVDIFFVISGYLITGLIIHGIANGNFSLAHFYARRIKRILPAYIVVALVTLAFSSYLLIPNDYIFYTTSLAASWAFASNIFFSMLSWGYFGQRTEEFPLLHTWSLSVEEQFYFIFPILLILLVRYCKRQLVPALLVSGLLFAAASEFKTGEVKSYFLLTARAHELLIGSLAFFISQRFRVQSTHAANALALLGATLILGSLFLIDSGTAFPGINSLYPCLGAALLIHACQSENIITPVLKSKPLVFIGLLSYSLYLWHWPIFSFLKYRRIDLAPWVVISAVALSFLLAFITWKYIETPIRRNRELDFKKAFIRIYLAPAAAFMSVGLYSYVTEGAPQRFTDDMRELISSYSFERDLTRSCSIRAEDYRKVTLTYLSQHCAFGDLSRRHAQVLLMGDSHAHHFKPFVDQLSKNAGLKAVYHVQGGCFPTALQATQAQPDKALSSCERRNADLLSLAVNFKYVVLAGFWSSEPERDLKKELEFAVGQIIRAGAVPVLFKDNPYYEPDLSRCILYRKRGWIDKDRNCNIPYSFVAHTQAPFDKIINDVKSKHPETLIIDPKAVMCDAAECVTYIANTALYKDANHINLKAAQLLGERYIQRQGNPFSHFQTARPAGDIAYARTEK